MATSLNLSRYSIKKKIDANITVTTLREYIYHNYTNFWQHFRLDQLEFEMNLTELFKVITDSVKATENRSRPPQITESF